MTPTELFKHIITALVIVVFAHVADPMLGVLAVGLVVLAALYLFLSALIREWAKTVAKEDGDDADNEDDDEDGDEDDEDEFDDHLDPEEDTSPATSPASRDVSPGTNPFSRN